MTLPGLRNGGTITALTNTGTIRGTDDYGIGNASTGSIGTLTNNAGGTITGGLAGIANGGTIDTLTNNAGGTITGGPVGIVNGGTIDTLANTGTIQVTSTGSRTPARSVRWPTAARYRP